MQQAVLPFGQVQLHPPYTVNKQGRGPSWANSLFEDNAEFGLGMNLAQRAVRDRLKEHVENIQNADVAAETKAACAAYLETFEDSDTNFEAALTLTKRAGKNC